MIIYGDEKQGKVEPIDYDDLVYLTKQLGRFLQVYKNKVFIPDKKQQMAIQALENIYDKLERGKFDQLIADPSLISFKQN